MAMTVNPDAGISAPGTLREEALYAFRFDLNHDARKELTFKVRFGPVASSLAQMSWARPPRSTLPPSTDDPSRMTSWTSY